MHSLKCKSITRTIVMTDSQKIANISKEYNAEVPFLEKQEFAQDHISMLTAVKQLIFQLQREEYLPDLIVLLQPTSPLRTIDDIDSSIDLMKQSNCDRVITVTEVEHPIEWTLSLTEDNFTKPLFDSHMEIRQKTEKYYRPNGCVYVFKSSAIGKSNPITKAIIMPRERSIDIDTKLDLLIAKTILSINEKKSGPSNQ